MKRVRVIPDASLVTTEQRSYPAVVTVELADGQRFTEAVTDVPGSPSAPWSFAEIELKFADTDRVGFSPAQRSALVATAAALPRAPDVSELMTATAVLTPFTRSERVGAAPGERT
jgi:hypothetical protein